MTARNVVVVALGVGLTCGYSLAQVTTPPTSAPATSRPADETDGDASSILERDTLTDNWLGMGKKPSEKGLDFKLNLTQVYQQNLRGGLSTHRRAGRYTGRYDLEGEADLGKLGNLPGGRIYALARGGWSDGMDESSIGSLFGANATAIGGRSIGLLQILYEQSLLGDKVRFRIGKIDLTNCLESHGCKACFDGSAYVNDESSQFLNGALVNNPTIPFSDPGLGAMVHIEPTDWWYLSAAVADAQADFRETGFNTAFHGRNDFFSIYETGILPRLPSAKGPLQGAYRVGMWYDPQPKDRFDGSGTQRDDVGFYASCDQSLWRENDEEDDTQGLGVFGRYGIADADVSQIKNFWSIGLQYRGLIPSRDKDVTSFGVAQGRLSRQADFTRASETVLEWFYNIELTPWLHVSPDVQYILNPGGDASVNDAVVVGGRVQVSF